MSDDEVLVGRCFTRVRRHPVMVGRIPGGGHIPGGGRLPGGPYTVPQLVVMVGAFVVLLATQGVWARFGPVVTVLVPVVVPYVLGWLVQRVRVDGRSPVAVAGSMLGAVGAPAGGRMGGHPVRAQFRPRRWRLLQAPLLHLSEEKVEAATAEPAADGAPVSVPGRVPSGAQMLLARRGGDR